MNKNNKKKLLEIKRKYKKKQKIKEKQRNYKMIPMYNK